MIADGITFEKVEPKKRTLRLTDQEWQALKDIAAHVVPSHALAFGTNTKASRVAPMLRMIADGRLTVKELGDE